ncbi:unnamed protein product [Lactuca virosa]|nr:unnamed protein product [Lactuca virosa]
MVVIPSDDTVCRLTPSTLISSYSRNSLPTPLLSFFSFKPQLICYLSNWLNKMKRKPMLAAIEKNERRLMLLGFISPLLVVTSSSTSNICIGPKD